jgi:hypothetical protein
MKKPSETTIKMTHGLPRPRADGVTATAAVLRILQHEQYAGAKVGQCALSLRQINAEPRSV